MTSASWCRPSSRGASARRTLTAEKLHGQVRDLVRLVENDRLGPGQELHEALLLHGQVGEQQVMIDDHEIGFLGAPPRADDVTIGIGGAFLPEAVVSRGRHEWPDS